MKQIDAIIRAEKEQKEDEMDMPQGMPGMM